MKLYVVDDDKNIQNILKMIIRDRALGTLCGIASNGADALEDMPVLKPDIVIVDLLMPEMDGITFVKKARTLLPSTAFIMLSQVASKDMIAGAYESGIEFYIQKPINSVEVETVVRKVGQSLSAQRTLMQVQNLFTSQQPAGIQPASPSSLSQERPHIVRLKGILQKLGIIGERGSRDIIQLVDYLVEHNINKSVEQRIRRSASAGMVNLANLGLEDYSNDTFTTYANTLYNFEQVRREMDYIRGKGSRHGNVKIKSFLNALMVACLEP